MLDLFQVVQSDVPGQTERLLVESIMLEYKANAVLMKDVDFDESDMERGGYDAKNDGFLMKIWASQVSD